MTLKTLALCASMLLMATSVQCETLIGVVQEIPIFGKGEAKAVNCSFGGGLPGNWLEITNMENFTQYTSTTDVTYDDVPYPAPAPWSVPGPDDGGERYSAPAFNGVCFSASPSTGYECTENCLVNIDLWGYKFLEFATFQCINSYPTPGLIDFKNPMPPPGNVTTILTKQCKNYDYKNGTWMATVTDTFGAKYALQTSSYAMPDDAAWFANLKNITWPPGWKMEIANLTESQIHVPYLYNGSCYMLVIRDDQGNAWHVYEYPESGTGLLSESSCPPLKALSAAAAAKGPSAAPAEAPAPASGVNMASVSASFLVAVLVAAIA